MHIYLYISNICDGTTKQNWRNNNLNWGRAVQRGVPVAPTYGGELTNRVKGSVAEVIVSVQNIVNVPDRHAVLDTIIIVWFIVVPLFLRADVLAIAAPVPLTLGAVVRARRPQSPAVLDT